MKNKNNKKENTMTKNNNLKIAEEYIKLVLSMTKEVWVSDNLPTLTSGDRKAILKVYKKHFHTVDYNSVTGICKCYQIDPAKYEVKENASVVDCISLHSDAVKQSTRDMLGIKESFDLVLVS